MTNKQTRIIGKMKLNHILIIFAALAMLFTSPAIAIPIPPNIYTPTAESQLPSEPIPTHSSSNIQQGQWVEVTNSQWIFFTDNSGVYTPIWITNDRDVYKDEGVELKPYMIYNYMRTNMWLSVSGEYKPSTSAEWVNMHPGTWANVPKAGWIYVTKDIWVFITPRIEVLPPIITVRADKTLYNKGEIVKFTIKNVGTTPIQIDWNTKVKIKNSKGIEIYSDNIACNPAPFPGQDACSMTPTILNKYQTYTWSWTQKQKVAVACIPEIECPPYEYTQVPLGYYYVYITEYSGNKSNMVYIK